MRSPIAGKDKKPMMPIAAVGSSLPVFAALMAEPPIASASVTTTMAIASAGTGSRRLTGLLRGPHTGPAGVLASTSCPDGGASGDRRRGGCHQDQGFAFSHPEGGERSSNSVVVTGV